MKIFSMKRNEIEEKKKKRTEYNSEQEKVLKKKLK